MAASSFLSPSAASKTSRTAGCSKALPKNTDAFFLAGSLEHLRWSRAVPTKSLTTSLGSLTTLWKAEGRSVMPTWTRDRLVCICGLLGSDSSSCSPASSTNASANLENEGCEYAPKQSEPQGPETRHALLDCCLQCSTSNGHAWPAHDSIEGLQSFTRGSLPLRLHDGWCCLGFYCSRPPQECWVDSITFIAYIVLCSDGQNAAMELNLRDEALL